MRIPSGVIIAFFMMAISSSQSHADIILTFSNNDTFEGDRAGDTAGSFTDPVTGIVGTITTRGVLPDGVLNPNAGSLGINAADGDDTAGSFDDEESWTFEWDVFTFFAGIDFDLFDQETETFSVQSNDWISLTGVSPASGDVTYTSSTGTFLFSSGSASDDFNLNDISGGRGLLVNPGTDIVISYSGNASDTSVIADMTFATPEPSTLLLVGSWALVIAGFSFLRHRKNRCGDLTAGAVTSE